jgi:hypothetical protein
MFYWPLCRVEGFDGYSIRDYRSSEDLDSIQNVQLLRSSIEVNIIGNTKINCTVALRIKPAGEVFLDKLCCYPKTRQGLGEDPVVALSKLTGLWWSNWIAQLDVRSAPDIQNAKASNT